MAVYGCKLLQCSPGPSWRQRCLWIKLLGEKIIALQGVKTLSGEWLWIHKHKTAHTLPAVQPGCREQSCLGALGSAPMCLERTMWENSTRSSLRNSTVPSAAGCAQDSTNGWTSQSTAD